MSAHTDMSTADSHLATAQESLLAPYDLDLGKLGPVFGSLADHRIDYQQPLGWMHNLIDLL